MRFGFGLLLVIPVAVLATAASATSQRPKLTGFAGIDFYMTEQQMQDAVPMIRSHEGDGKTAWFYGVSPIDIAGREARLWAMLDAGTVRRLGAGRASPMEHSDCRASFDAVVGYVSNQFGPPDSSAQQDVTDSYRARYEFADRAVIEIMSTTGTDKKSCLDFITYYAPSVP